MSHFDEKSGVVYSLTQWGQWAQTIEEVCVEVEIAGGTTSRNIVCEMTPTSLTVTVNNTQVLKVCKE